MSFPIFDLQHNIALNIQVTARKKRNSTLPAGFSMFDEMFISISAKLL